MISQSSCSSSEAYAGGNRTSDIIDLDQFMRARVKPSREDRGLICNSTKNRLVVDAGYSRNQSGQNSSCSERRHKRCSLDSGVSDHSYLWRRRRSSIDRANEVLRQRHRSNARTDSLRAFRVQYERTLQQQNEQIERVAKLCEKMTLMDSHRTSRKQRSAFCTRTDVTCTSDSSDLSSSTRSSMDMAGRKHRTDSGRTYKMIMHKLDDLNRLFIARRVTSPMVKRSISETVSTSVETAAITKRVERGVGDMTRSGKDNKSRISSFRTTNMHMVDIAPRKELQANDSTKRFKNNTMSESSFASDRHHSELKLKTVPQDIKRPRIMCVVCRGCWRWIQQLFITEDTT